MPEPNKTTVETLQQAIRHEARMTGEAIGGIRSQVDSLRSSFDSARRDLDLLKRTQYSDPRAADFDNLHCEMGNLQKGLKDVAVVQQTLETGQKTTLRDIYWLMAFGGFLIAAGAFNIYLGSDKLSRKEATDQVDQQFHKHQSNFQIEIYEDLLDTYSYRTLEMAKYMSLSGLAGGRERLLQDLHEHVTALKERIAKLEKDTDAQFGDRSLQRQGIKGLHLRAISLESLLKSFRAIVKTRGKGYIDEVDRVSLDELSRDSSRIIEVLARSMSALAYVRKNDLSRFSPEAEEHARKACDAEYKVGLAHNILAVNRSLQAEEFFVRGRSEDAVKLMTEVFKDLLEAANTDGTPQSWFRFYNNHSFYLGRLLRWHIEKPGEVTEDRIRSTLGLLTIDDVVTLLRTNLDQATLHAGSAISRVKLGRTQAECLGVLARFTQLRAEKLSENQADSKAVLRKQAETDYLKASNYLISAIEQDAFDEDNPTEVERKTGRPGWIAAILRRSPELKYLLSGEDCPAEIAARVQAAVDSWIAKQANPGTPVAATK